MGGGQRTNGLAVASLVLGIVGVILCVLFIPWILAIIFGAIGIKQCNNDPTYTGKGLAVAGLVLGLISAVITLSVLAFGDFDLRLRLRRRRARPRWLSVAKHWSASTLRQTPSPTLTWSSLRPASVAARPCLW